MGHTDDLVDRTIDALAAALPIYRRGLADGVDRYLDGRPVRPALRRRG